MVKYQTPTHIRPTSTSQKWKLQSHMQRLNHVGSEYLCTKREICSAKSLVSCYIVLQISYKLQHNFWGDMYEPHTVMCSSSKFNNRYTYVHMKTVNLNVPLTYNKVNVVLLIGPDSSLHQFKSYKVHITMYKWEKIQFCQTTVTSYLMKFKHYQHPTMPVLLLSGLKSCPKAQSSLLRYTIKLCTALNTCQHFPIQFKHNSNFSCPW